MEVGRSREEKLEVAARRIVGELGRWLDEEGREGR